MSLINWHKKFGGSREVAAVLLLVTLVAANVFFSLPAKPALSESKPQPGPRAVKPDEYTKVFGGKNDFESETIDDGQIKPLPLDLVEEKSGAGGDAAKKEVPASVKADTEKSDKPDFSTTQGGETTTLLNGTDIEIATLVKAFSKLTKRNYIVDNNVKGKVTVHLTTPVSVDEAVRIFESILLLKGFTTVPLGSNIWKVINTKDAQKSTIPIVAGGKEHPSDVLVTQLVRLKHTQASELQSILNQFISKDGLLSVFAGTNSLIVIDSEANIKRLIELVNELDVPAIDQDITIIPILHADAKDVADKIQQILGEDKDKESASRAQLGTQPRPVNFVPPMGVTPPTTQNASLGVVAGDKRTLPLKIIADERTNSVIVVADALLTAKVKALAEQLDSKTDQSGGKFYVYRLKHADAEELSDILNSLISGSGGGSSSSSSSNKKSKTSGSSLSRGGSRNSRRDSTGNNNRLSGSLSGTAALTSTDPSNPTSGKVAFDGDISISADSSTNSLVVNASKSDYEKLKQVIDDLDIRRQQVLVEATIMQVSLDRSQGVGVEWTTALGTDDFGAIGQNNFGGLTNLISNPAALSDLTLAAASSGSIVLPGGITLPSQAVLISALSRNTNVNVLSSPTILATDNEEAEIVVGQNVPFITSTSTNATNLNNTFNSIERQDVGITLRITPQISAGGFVVLKIFVEVSSVVSGTQNDPNGPTTSVNTTETTVEVKSNQMIVTGGLISDEVSDATRGVPFLEDIPVLGHLFKRSDSTRRRNNLLIFITPKVVSDQFVAREQTKEKSGRMKSEIEKLEAEPDRSEVLDSANMDEVAEDLPPRDITPGTITRPKGARNLSLDEQEAEARTAARIRELAGGKEVIEKSSGEELSFTVKPKLPGEGGGNPPAAASRSTMKNSTETSSATSAAKTYVVLRQLGGNPTMDLPFHYADGERTVGIVVLGSQSSSPGKFFTIGRRYLFRQGEEDIPFVCLGTFGSRADAQALQASLSAEDLWYSLSPADSIGLGRNEWRAF